MSTISLWGPFMSAIAPSVAAAGLVGAGISYFYLGREQSIDLFGLVNLPEYAVDGLFIAVATAGGKIGSVYILPNLPQSLMASQGMANFISMSLAPGLSGAILTFGKPMLVDTYSYSKLEDFLLGAGSNLAGDKLASMWSGMGK
jgi:hypothetical protein